MHTNNSIIFFVVFILSFLLVSKGGAVELNSGLVVNYSFDSFKKDQEGEARVHGAIPIKNRLGTVDSALGFDGVDDYVEIDDFDCALEFDHDWSVNMWVKLDGKRKSSVFFAGADGDARAKQFVIASTYVKLSHEADTDADWRVNFAKPEQGSWHMYTVTWEKRGLLRVYVDGKFKGEDGVGLLAEYCPKHEPIIGGVNFYRKTQFFKGSIDDFRIYDRILDKDEITQLYSLTDS